jgi:hypothetical protein
MANKKILFLSIVFGISLFLVSAMSTNAADCTTDGPCQGKNQNDDCIATSTTGTTKPGTCGIFTPPAGGCACWPKASSSTLPNSNSAYETCIDSGGTFESCAKYDTATTAPATATATGTVINGNGCFSDSECQSNNCSMTGTDQNYETGAGTCRAIGTAATDKSAGLPTADKSAELPTADKTSNLTGNGIEIPGNTGLPDPKGGIKTILTNLLTWLLGIVGIIALIGFVISGIQYIIAAGDDTRMETAKKNMTYSIIGIIIALAGFVIVQAIDFALRGMSF